MKTIAFVRHGRANLGGERHGELSEKGVAQLKRTATWLKNQGLGRVCIIASPSIRTLMSGDTISETLEVPCEVQQFLAGSSFHRDWFEHFKQFLEAFNKNPDHDCLVIVSHLSELDEMAGTHFGYGECLIIDPGGRKRSFQP